MRKALVVASVAALTAAFVGAVAIAQPQQVVTPPKVIYWVSADTTAGLAAMGMASMAQMRSGAPPSQVRTLKLELGSTLAPSPSAPNAAHDIPPALNMGRALDLRTPTRGQTTPTPRDPTVPDTQNIKGRLLLFWGCGERAGPGQPLIVDFASVQQGQMPAGLSGATLNLQPERGPSPDRSRTFGEWPNPDVNPMRRNDTAVPANGSLVGAHFIHGNYTPDIRFSLGADRDFMAGVQMTQTTAPSGSVALSWAAIPHATGYFASVIGGMQGQGGAGSDMVMWSSSARKIFGGPLNVYLSPADATRLVGERVVMAPSTTTCTVPLEVTRAAPQAAMLMFSAFGPESNFVHPARPADARTPWNQEWVAKVRFKSGSMSMLGVNGTNMAGMPGLTPEQQAEMQRMQCEQARAQQGAVSGGIGSAIGSATGIPGAGVVGGAMGRAFGRSKQKDQPADPNCPAP